jgi:hypothetical protein
VPRAQKGPRWRALRGGGGSRCSSLRQPLRMFIIKQLLGYGCEDGLIRRFCDNLFDLRFSFQLYTLLPGGSECMLMF